MGTGGGAGAAGRGPHCTRGGGRGDRDPALAVGTVPTLNPLARTSGTVSCLSAPLSPALRHGFPALCCAGAAAVGSLLPSCPGRALRHLGAGLRPCLLADVAPLSPALMDPNPGPGRLGIHQGLGGGGRKLLTGWHRPPWPRTGKELCPSAGAVPLVVPTSPWDPLPMSHIQHPIRVLRWVLLPAAAWDPASPGLCPCSGWGSAWAGGTPWGCHRPLRPGGAARWGGPTGYTVAAWPQCPRAPEPGWDRHPKSCCPWNGAGPGWWAHEGAGAGVTPISRQLGHGRQCVLDVGDQREPEPP